MEPKPQITYDDFVKLDLRVGTVLECSDHPNADKLLVAKVDLGPDGVRQIVAGLRGPYQAADLVGKQIIVVANLAPRVMRGLESQGMLLAGSESLADGTRKVVVMTPAAPLAPGSTVS